MLRTNSGLLMIPLVVIIDTPSRLDPFAPTTARQA